MAKNRTSAYMTAGEQIAGVIFFVIYLLVLPLVLKPAFAWAGRLLGTTIRPALQHLIYYYPLTVVTILIFHGFLGRTCRNFAGNFAGTGKFLLVGLIAFYGSNELFYRLSNFVIRNGTNLNRCPISAQVEDAPRTTLLILLLLAPFVEEVLFRGLVFGNLKGKSPLLAYGLSAALFALYHVWQWAVIAPNTAHFVLMLQYLLPGLVLAWVYEKTGTLMTPLLLHISVNILAILP